MRIKALCCEVFARQVYYVAALSPHIIDIELVDKVLHVEPDTLRQYLQSRIDTLEPGRYDAIALGYGLCSNSVAGLVCPHTRIVVPRAHDCIALYLGSRERYGQEFRETPGTYWYTPDYIERSDRDTQVALGSSDLGDAAAATYEEYVTRFGKDNADYLMEVMGAWREHYERAAYIENADMPLPDYADTVRDEAKRRGWRYESITGGLVLIRDLLEGRWDDDRYQVVSPGATLAPSYDERVVAEQPQP